MANTELIQKLLEDKKIQQEQLQKELEELDTKLKIVIFEEDMYYRLAESRYKYKEVLSNKQEICDNRMKELESNINKLKEELAILEMEIEYIEKVLN